MEDLGEIVAEFLSESHENLDQLHQDLVDLEQQPQSRELISRIFRTIHTIKGTSGFLAFPRLETLTHAGESLLSRLRDGAQPVTPQTIAILTEVVDGVRSLLSQIEQTQTEGDVTVDAVITAVHAQLAAANDPVAVAPEPDVEQPVSVVDVPARPAPEPVEGQRRPLGEILVQTGASSHADVSSALQQQLEGDQRHLGTILLDEGKAAPAAVVEALQTQTMPKRTAADSAIQVDVGLLDNLMNLVGELVLARNQLVRGVGETGDSALVRSAQRLGTITSELQEGVMKTRMQPIEHIFAKLPSVVLALSAGLGKHVQLVLEGQETQLDRSLLDAVQDPLIRLVRSAVDAGIEAPELRAAAGKNLAGTLTLRAYHEGGQVSVEVADDGAGHPVDPTARQAVQGAIERIGGTVAVDSTAGEGTVWRLSIPLTLAIIQALTVGCGDQRYVVPQVSVLELVFIDGQATRIEDVSGAPVYRLRGTPLPVVRLDRALGLDVSADQGVYLMVLQADGHRFGLVVDRVLNTEEIVVKSLSTDVGPYAGATILGDGKVGLILDIPSLARRSQAGAAEHESVIGTSRAAGTTSRAERLLITAVGERRVAIPLDTVTRLEEFPRDRIERAGSREVVQYGGQPVPLVRLSHLLGTDTEGEQGETVLVVVYREGGNSVALVVDRIVEIAENPAVAPRDVEEDGLVGAAVIQQRVTELLDVRRAILAADPNFYRNSPDHLLVEA